MTFCAMWLGVAVIAYFINAGVYVADKFLLSKKIHSSVTYAFYVGIWSIFNFILLIFFPWVPSFHEFLIDIFAGALFLGTLIFWYKALHQSEATRVVPIVGALVPVFSLILSAFFLKEALDERHMLAFFVLVAGGVLISIKNTKVHIWEKFIGRIEELYGEFSGETHAEYRPTRRLVVNSVISAFFFAAYYVLMKYIYNSQPFIGSFVWSRLGTFLAVISMLFIPAWRKLIFAKREETEERENLFFFLSVRILAAAAFIMLNWAISLGNVAMISALQGVQFLFLIVLVLVLSKKFPHILKEELGHGVLAQKVIGVMLVVTGLYILMT